MNLTSPTSHWLEFCLTKGWQPLLCIIKRSYRSLRVSEKTRGNSHRVLPGSQDIMEAHWGPSTGRLPCCQIRTVLLGGEVRNQETCLKPQPIQLTEPRAVIGPLVGLSLQAGEHPTDGLILRLWGRGYKGNTHCKGGPWGCGTALHFHAISNPISQGWCVCPKVLRSLGFPLIHVPPWHWGPVGLPGTFAVPEREAPSGKLWWSGREGAKGSYN